jgi:hypothetical protein
MLTLGQQLGNHDENDLHLDDTQPTPCDFSVELDALRCLDTQEMQPIALSQNVDTASKV